MVDNFITQNLNWFDKVYVSANQIRCSEEQQRTNSCMLIVSSRQS